MIVTCVLTNFVGSVAEVAVIVTVPPIGTASGAVYVVCVTLAVCAGLNDPHAIEAHVTVQFTPPALGSLLTSTPTCAVPFTASEDGGPGAKPTLIGTPVIVSVTLELIDGFTVAAAVIVTVPFAGTAAGAW